jgi:uncharacterized protein (UPF0276 family)
MGRSFGITLKREHCAELLAGRPSLGLIEIHAENFMGDGGPPMALLDALRTDYPLSVHGTGLSLGSAEPLDRAHLGRLKRLADRYEPILLSEHLGWNRLEGVVLNDFLPMPYTEEALGLVIDHLDQAQTALQRRILIENPAGYLRYSADTMSEPEFISALCRATGCGWLLDLNNLVVTAGNLGLSASRYLDQVPIALVDEIHLAGHWHGVIDGAPARIDDHGSPVGAETWQLYGSALTRANDVATVIEWDNGLPSLDTLLAEMGKAQQHAAGPVAVAA